MTDNRARLALRGVALVTGGCGGLGRALCALRGIRRNRAVVAPARAGLIWRAARFSPRLAEQVVTRAMRAELES